VTIQAPVPTTSKHLEQETATEDGSLTVPARTRPDPARRRRNVIRVGVAMAVLLGLYGVNSIGGNLRSTLIWSLFMLGMLAWILAGAAKDRPGISPRLRMAVRVFFWSGILALSAMCISMAFSPTTEPRDRAVAWQTIVTASASLIAYRLRLSPRACYLIGLVAWMGTLEWFGYRANSRIKPECLALLVLWLLLEVPFRSWQLGRQDAEPQPARPPSEENLELIEGITGGLQMIAAIFAAITFYVTLGQLLYARRWPDDAGGVFLFCLLLMGGGPLCRQLARRRLLPALDPAKQADWVRAHDLSWIRIFTTIILIGACPLALFTLMVTLGSFMYGEGWLSFTGDMWIYCSLLSLAMYLWRRHAEQRLGGAESATHSDAVKIP
jgi:hypothetical protein